MKLPRFGLGTLCLALAVMSVALAWATSIVRERRQTLDRLVAEAEVSYITGADQRAALAGYDLPSEFSDAQVPWWREWLGDEAIENIYFSPERRPTEEERDLVRRVFPEAELIQQEYPPI